MKVFVIPDCKWLQLLDNIYVSVFQSIRKVIKRRIMRTGRVTLLLAIIPSANHVNSNSKN